MTIGGACLGMLLVSAIAIAIAPPSFADTSAQAVAPILANVASSEARQTTAWVISTQDNRGRPFMIIDKINAQALAFDGHGRLVGAAPVLLGVAHGDASPPGIGARALRDIPPEDRITPAGRFVVTLGQNLTGSDILWVDYNAAISFHRVFTGTPADQRLQRLATPTADDNRISYGCINAPVDFYERVVRPLFTATTGVVYILPETRSIEEVFFIQASTSIGGAKSEASPLLTERRLVPLS